MHNDKEYLYLEVNKVKENQETVNFVQTPKMSEEITAKMNTFEGVSQTDVSQFYLPQQPSTNLIKATSQVVNIH